MPDATGQGGNFGGGGLQGSYGRGGGENAGGGVGSGGLGFGGSGQWGQGLSYDQANSRGGNNTESFKSPEHKAQVLAAEKAEAEQKAADALSASISAQKEPEKSSNVFSFAYDVVKTVVDTAGFVNPIAKSVSIGWNALERGVNVAKKSGITFNGSPSPQQSGFIGRGGNAGTGENSYYRTNYNDVKPVYTPIKTPAPVVNSFNGVVNQPQTEITPPKQTITLPTENKPKPPLPPVSDIRVGSVPNSVIYQTEETSENPIKPLILIALGYAAWRFNQ